MHDKITVRMTFVILISVLFVSLISCGKKEVEIEKAIVEGQDAKIDQPSIRIAMSAAFVSEAGVEIYKSIADYLTEQTGKKFEFVTGMSYSTINDMIINGAVDFGFVCGLPYVLGRDLAPPKLKLVVAPVMKLAQYNGQPKYFSYVIVRKDSGFKTFSDLKGSHFVYNDALSNSGYNMPRARLVELGRIEGFFATITRSGSHEESIRMVALGEADASSVDSLVLDYDLEKNPEYARKVRIIEMMGPAGIPPLVASVMTDQELVRKVQEVLVKMKDDPVGRAILDSALVKRFELVDDSNYDDIRHMMKLAEKAGFIEIR